MLHRIVNNIMAIYYPYILIYYLSYIIISNFISKNTIIHGQSKYLILFKINIKLIKILKNSLEYLIFLKNYLILYYEV